VRFGTDGGAMMRSRLNCGRVSVRAFLVLWFVGATPAAAIDLSGSYVSMLDVLSVPCTLTFAQSGTALTIAGPCTLGNTYTFDLSGSVDPLTGAFTATGRLIGLCDTPGSVSMTGSGDGELFSAVSSCGSLTSAVSGTKCGNGIVDASEDCEDGNASAGDCCSPSCLFEGAGSPCAADTNSCTSDVCDSAGMCQHQPASIGSSCAPDFNDCTDDVCDAGGQCTHPPISAAPCDDTNPCTTADTCAAGTCVGGPIAPECVGSIDLTGDWTVMVSTGGLFNTTDVHHFVQSGAVLESSVGQGVGVGSVNPATGAFETHTPYVVIYAQCDEVITATASPDAQSFSGTVIVFCGLEGFFGPYTVTGQRCVPGSSCGCNVATSCTAAEMSHVAIRVKTGGALTRWQWVSAPATASFGDPMTETDFQLCVETAATGYTATVAHGSGWRATRSGFRYRSTSDIVHSLVLKATAKKTVISASLLPDVLPMLPASTPLRIRLVRGGTTPACFEAQFADPSVNSATRYIATQ
jgi:cysteine-rich repeat protein